MQRHTFHPLCLLAGLIVTLAALTACNSKESNEDADTLYAPPTDVAINSFKLNANANLLRGLDSVYFSIDLQKALVFNADSLPKGTDITKLVPNITYSQYITSAIIEMTGGKVRTGTVDYKKQPGDSIDFSGRVTITLTSTSGNSRSYELKVNVHETEPDSLCWGKTALSTLPSRSASPRSQRTVMMGTRTICMLQEADGSYTLASTDHPDTKDWERRAVTLPFTPRLRTLNATSSALYMLDSQGKLHTSADGINWSETSATWTNIIGAYGDQLLGLRQTADGQAITSLSGIYPEVPLTGEMASFPIEDYTNLFCYQSKWMAEPIAVITGGITRDGEVSDCVWGFDGTTWALLSKGQLPALRGATLVPYYSYLRTGGTWIYDEFSTLLVLGGMDAEGEFNKDLYLSYNNGVTFTKGTGLMQMPEFIPGMWMLDNVIATRPRSADIVPQGWTEMPSTKLHPWYRISTEVSGGNIYWECPYIYLFGGCDETGRLYDTVWRGVINRLTFTPII